MRMRVPSFVLLAITLLVVVSGCPRGGSSGQGDQAQPTASPAAASTAAPAPAASAVELDVVFSSEKKDWAQEAIDEFNASHSTTADARPIHVAVTFGGSVEPIADIVAGKTKAHVFSPASSLVLPLLNDQWTGANGATAKTVVTAADPLVLSPVVIAMWEPMARALGWPAKKLGWSEVAALARSPDGWRGKGHAEWGDFRFGHTHPGYSNSGLIAVLAETYAAVSKTRDLDVADVTKPSAVTFVRDIEGSVVHYGRSTGFFYDTLAQHGPAYLSAAVLYENLVVSSSKDQNLAMPLVCVYPKEGTQWADHPYAVLDAPWVGAPERDAAAKLKAYLLSRPVQERAMTKYGFRPALTDIPLASPIDAAHGADPKEPQTLLGTPNVGVLRAVLDQWKKTKRGVSVVVVFDRSGSMAGPRVKNARDGLSAFLGTLQPTDRVVILTFNGHLDPPTAPMPPAEAQPRVQSIFAEGETALYDAVLRGRDIAEQDPDKKHIHAVVVLTDGEDNKSASTLADTLTKLTPVEQGSAVRIFTIGYGTDANGKVLGDIAKRTGGVYYHGDVDNIRSIYDEIASFF